MLPDVPGHGLEGSLLSHQVPSSEGLNLGNTHRFPGSTSGGLQGCWATRFGEARLGKSPISCWSWRLPRLNPLTCCWLDPTSFTPPPGLHPSDSPQLLQRPFPSASSSASTPRGRAHQGGVPHPNQSTSLELTLPMQRRKESMDLPLPQKPSALVEKTHATRWGLVTPFAPAHLLEVVG